MEITQIAIITNCQVSLIFSFVYLISWFLFLKVKKENGFAGGDKKHDLSLPMPSFPFGHKFLKCTFS